MPTYNLSIIIQLTNDAFGPEELTNFCFLHYRHVYEQFKATDRKRTRVRMLIEDVDRKGGMEQFLNLIKAQNEFQYNRYAERLYVTEQSENPYRFFIGYKRNSDPDQQLAEHLKNVLTSMGHYVFSDKSLRIGEAWMNQIDQEIKNSDFLIVLLSEASMNSEMIWAEVKRAYDYRELQGKPQTLPVRIQYEGLLPYAVEIYVGSVQYVVWQTEADHQRIVEDILSIASGEAAGVTNPDQQAAAPPPNTITGEPDKTVSQQSPSAVSDPRSLIHLPSPGGPVKFRDKFYVEREGDGILKSNLVQMGTTSIIRAPRQSGKTSLLIWSLHHAKEQGAKVVMIDLQSFGRDRLRSQETFLREFAETICRHLRLDVSKVEAAWSGGLGAPQKLTYFLEDEVLPKFKEPIILAMDEADSLLRSTFYQDFFGLIRAWVSNQAFYSDVWGKLNVVLVISTEPYLLIDDINQSPFNVGTQIKLPDFTAGQISDLNHRHGSPLSAQHLSAFSALFGGQPYLTRNALYLLVKKQYTWSKLQAQAASEQGPFSDHLKRHHWGIQQQSQLKQTLIDVLQMKAMTDKDSLNRLVRAGLITNLDDTYRFRCDLYQEYFKRQLL